jgi:hypothetical protein
VSDAAGDTTGCAPLSVAAELTFTVNGAEATVESTGERLFVSFGSLPDATRALRGQPDDIEESLAALLGTTDLTVEVRVRNRIVAVAGVGARPGPVSRWLGVAPIEARPAGVVGAAVAEVSAGARGIRRFLA